MGIPFVFIPLSKIGTLKLLRESLFYSFSFNPRIRAHKYLLTPTETTINHVHFTNKTKKVISKHGEAITHSISGIGVRVNFHNPPQNKTKTAPAKHTINDEGPLCE